MVHIDSVALAVLYNQRGDWIVNKRYAVGVRPYPKPLRDFTYLENTNAKIPSGSERVVTYHTEENTLSYFLWAWKEKQRDTRKQR